MISYSFAPTNKTKILPSYWVHKLETNLTNYKVQHKIEIQNCCWFGKGKNHQLLWSLAHRKVPDAKLCEEEQLSELCFSSCASDHRSTQHSFWWKPGFTISETSQKSEVSQKETDVKIVNFVATKIVEELYDRSCQNASRFLKEHYTLMVWTNDTIK